MWIPFLIDRMNTINNVYKHLMFDHQQSDLRLSIEHFIILKVVYLLKENCLNWWNWKTRCWTILIMENGKMNEQSVFIIQTIRFWSITIFMNIPFFVEIEIIRNLNFLSLLTFNPVQASIISSCLVCWSSGSLSSSCNVSVPLSRSPSSIVRSDTESVTNSPPIRGEFIISSVVWDFCRSNEPNFSKKPPSISWILKWGKTIVLQWIELKQIINGNWFIS